VTTHLTEVFSFIWIGWLVSWVAASFWSGRTEKRVATWQISAYRTAMIAGGVLLVPWTARALKVQQIWQISYDWAFTLVGVMLVGILFTWWARIHLGGLWSSAITRKEGHRVVDTGPYAFVRHPIYTGLIVAVLATAAAEATVSSLFGAGLIAFGLWLKARIEERFLMVELGPDAYLSYRRRVPMLLPFLPRQ
jgi:protein-S-isoprenylcysteine O-methyltransferase Ste14